MYGKPRKVNMDKYIKYRGKEILANLSAKEKSEGKSFDITRSILRAVGVAG